MRMMNIPIDLLALKDQMILYLFYLYLTLLRVEFLKRKEQLKFIIQGQCIIHTGPFSKLSLFNYTIQNL